MSRSALQSLKAVAIGVALVRSPFAPANGREQEKKLDFSQQEVT
jgi:hypothetical protein